MKSLLLSVFFMGLSFSIAQNSALDFMVTSNNDTIFGALQKTKLIEKTDDNKLVTHSIDSAKSIRKNDIIYNRISKDFEVEEPMKALYYTNDFVSIVKPSSDFIVTSTNDSIFGKIKTPLFGPKYIKSNTIKAKICEDDALSYRKNNSIYDLKTLGNPILSKEKNVFLKRLYNGKANLYAYKILRSDVGTVKPKTFYIIEKDKQLHLISNSNSKQDLVDLFIDNSKLSDLIFDDFYTVETIYLILKYYDLN
jgi:hypothetical protein